MEYVKTRPHHLHAYIDFVLKTSSLTLLFLISSNLPPTLYMPTSHLLLRICWIPRYLFYWIIMPQHVEKERQIDDCTSIYNDRSYHACIIRSHPFLSRVRLLSLISNVGVLLASIYTYMPLAARDHWASTGPIYNQFLNRFCRVNTKRYIT